MATILLKRLLTSLFLLTLVIFMLVLWTQPKPDAFSLGIREACNYVEWKQEARALVERILARPGGWKDPEEKPTIHLGRTLVPGDLLRRTITFGFTHWGLYVGEGKVAQVVVDLFNWRRLLQSHASVKMIPEAEPSIVCFSTLREFLSGSSSRGTPPYFTGEVVEIMPDCTARDRATVMRAAAEAVGIWPYKVVENNCEHFLTGVRCLEGSFSSGVNNTLPYPVNKTIRWLFSGTPSGKGWESTRYGTILKDSNVFLDQK
jgi:hypothetical protein